MATPVIPDHEVEDFWGFVSMLQPNITQQPSPQLLAISALPPAVPMINAEENHFNLLFMHGEDDGEVDIPPPPLAGDDGPAAAAIPAPHYDWTAGSPASVIDMTGLSDTESEGYSESEDDSGSEAIESSDSGSGSPGSEIESGTDSEGESIESVDTESVQSAVDICLHCGGEGGQHLIAAITRSGREVMAPNRYTPLEACMHDDE